MREITFTMTAYNLPSLREELDSRLGPRVMAVSAAGDAVTVFLRDDATAQHEQAAAAVCKQHDPAALTDWQKDDAEAANSPLGRMTLNEAESWAAAAKDDEWRKLVIRTLAYLWKSQRREV